MPDHLNSTPTTHPSFSAHSVTVWRNDELVLNRVDLTVTSGQTVLITGHNGSGKTTLLRVLAGLRQADEGSVLLNEQEAGADRERWAQHVAYCGHQNGLSDTLTVRENLRFVYAIYGGGAHGSARIATEHALSKLGIPHLADWPLGKLSAGQRRRATLASLLMRNTWLWLLDEPFTAIDSDGRDNIERTISDHTQNGGACILSSHQDLVSSTLRASTAHVMLQRPVQSH